MRRKGNMPFNKEITQTVPQSGISDKKIEPRRPLPPAVLKYPDLLDSSFLPSIKDSLCYIIKPYQLSGLSVLISKDEKHEDTAIMFSDWQANKLDLNNKSDNLVNIADKFLSNHIQLFINFMRLIKIKQAQFFFSGEDYENMILVDMQTSLNKMCGPGMLRDLFSKIIKTQEVLKVEAIDDRALAAIETGNGIYEGNIIIKPSRFRHYHDVQNNIFTPLYIGIKR